MTTLLSVTGWAHSTASQAPSASSDREFQRVARSPSNALAATNWVFPWSSCQALEAEYIAFAVRFVFAAFAGPTRPTASSRAPTTAPPRHRLVDATSRFMYPLLPLVSRLQTRAVASRGGHLPSSLDVWFRQQAGSPRCRLIWSIVWVYA